MAIFYIFQVYMTIGDEGFVLDEFESNSEWDVIETSAYEDEETTDSDVVFTIKLKRKPLYVLLSVIMPIIMLAVLNIFVFVLPSDCGEKASYSITVFLAFAVFLSIISATFPENSEVVALFSIYLIIQTLQSTIITLIALILTRVISFDSQGIPVPPRLIWCLKVITFSCCFKKCRRNQVISISHKSKADTKNMTNEDIESTHDTRLASKENGNIEEETDDDPTRFNTWKEVVNTLDVVYFVFFTFVLVISTIIFFALSVN